MDGVRDFLEDVRRHRRAEGNFLGLLNVLVGRRITRPDGRVISSGLTWRGVAAWLKKVRWPRDAVRELGLDPAALPPRDRERFWYVAISLARIDSEDAMRAGDRFAQQVGPAGFIVVPRPSSSGPAVSH